MERQARAAGECGPPVALHAAHRPRSRRLARCRKRQGHGPTRGAHPSCRSPGPVRQGLGAEIGFVERLVAFWSNHFCVSVAKGDVVRVQRGVVRARGDPAPRARPLRRHAAGGRAASRHAVLSRQRPVGRPGLARRPEPQARPQREPRARDPGTAHARGRRRLQPGRRDELRPRPHRLDHGGPRRPASASPAPSCSTPTRTSPATRCCSARPISTAASARARPRSTDLARHPATARHIATKLVRHFIADEPPAAAVDRIAAVFRGPRRRSAGRRPWP